MTLSNQLSFGFILPEVILSGGILLILFSSIFSAGKKNSNGTGSYTGALLSALIYIAALVALFINPPEASSGTLLFMGQIHIDKLANFFRILMVFVGLLTVLFSLGNPELEKSLSAEYQVLIMGSIVGGMFMSMAANLIMVYLSIEFVSLLSYVLTAFKIKNAKASEGAIKYVLFGAISSGVMLFGFSFIYGITGSMDLNTIAPYLQKAGSEQIVIYMGIILALAGLSYKVAAAPFHFWCPDVYEGAATPITAFFSVGPKVAGFALLIRFFIEAVGFNTLATNVDIFTLIAVIAALTMTIGNFAALQQNNVKRMLAYSSISHAGYAFAALAAFSQFATTAIAFYLFAYLIMNVGAFLVAMAVGTKKDSPIENMDISSFNGLAYRGRRGALWATVMVVFLVSLAGLPPMVGFIGKYYVFSAMLQKGLIWLAVIGVLNSVVSLFYYARIMKAMIFTDGVQDDGKDLFSPWHYSALATVLAVLTIVFGILPNLITLP